MYQYTCAMCDQVVRWSSERNKKENCPQCEVPLVRIDIDKTGGCPARDAIDELDNFRAAQEATKEYNPSETYLEYGKRSDSIGKQCPFQVGRDCFRKCALFDEHNNACAHLVQARALDGIGDKLEKMSGDKKVIPGF